METYTLEEATRTARLVEKMLTDIDSAYGRRGLSPKAYHNVTHTRNVIFDADAMAAAENLSYHDRYILRCAAVGHDSKHGLGPVHNERASAAKLFLEMNKAGFMLADCQRASDLVLATIVHRSGEKIWQEVTDDPLSMILADADLANLGKRPLRYWAGQLSLYRETYALRPFDRHAIAEFSLDFITKHEFNTQTAQVLFPYKDQNILFLKNILAA